MSATQTVPVRSILQSNATTRLKLGKRFFVGEIWALWANIVAVTLGTALVAVFIGVSSVVLDSVFDYTDRGFVHSTAYIFVLDLLHRPGIHTSECVLNRQR